jgi:aryl-alcohol dehydrogenase-like predicted oxidoreductase
MKKRTLGSTGLEVTEIAMGGLFVSSVGGEYEQAEKAIHRALELGINYIDTAPGYRNSEEVLGKALKGVEAPYYISTKLGGRPQPFDAKDKGALRRSVEESLRQLKRDTIDILMIHEPERPGQYDWWDNLYAPGGPAGPVLDLMDELKAEGIIRFTGIGGTTAYELPRLIESGRFDVVLTAFNYSLLWREAEIEILPAAKKAGMGVVIGSPLQQGALSKRYDDEVNGGAPWLSKPRREQYQALYALLDEIDMELPELAMRFVVSNPDISCMLSGSRSAAEVETNITAVEKGPLPEELLKRLDEIASMVPFRPFEEPFGLPFGARGEHYKGPGHAMRGSWR